MKQRRHLIDTRFGQVHCREAGNGSAIVISHINQQSSALMVELIAALAPRHRAIAIDYPSHGMSDPVDDQPSIEDYANCVVDVMNGLGVDRAAALGEATGAAVAVELGVIHAGRIDAAILVNCPYYRDRQQAHDVHSDLKQDKRPADASGFPLTRTLDFMRDVDPAHSPLHPDQSWMDRINRAQIEVGRRRWQALDALNAYDISAGFDRLTVPTLILMADHFHYTAQLDDYLRRIPPPVAGKVIEGARFGMTWEKADEIAADVIAFLADV
jgi:pimeloyl-ACP methyl ester carboxylesterase